MRPAASRGHVNRDFTDNEQQAIGFAGKDADTATGTPGHANSRCRGTIQNLPTGTQYPGEPQLSSGGTGPTFFERDEVRGLRLHAEYLKPELLLREHGIRDTIVVYGSTRIPEPATAARNVKALQQVLQANPGDGNVVRKLAVAERILAKSHYYEVAREFGRLAAVKKELDQEYNAQVGLKTQSSKDVAPAKISSNLRT